MVSTRPMATQGYCCPGRTSAGFAIFVVFMSLWAHGGNVGHTASVVLAQPPMQSHRTRSTSNGTAVGPAKVSSGSLDKLH